MNIKNLTNGILKENPTFVQMLGMCPTLGVTVSAINGLGMGIATTAVLILSNIFISALRKVIPAKIRIPAFIVIIASAVTIVGMLMETYMPDLYDVLGLFIPLIVVNCIILARAEAFAFENNVFDSALDGIGMGLGFTMSLTILGIVREFFGEFKFFGNLLFSGAEPMLIMIQPPGAFLTLALLLAIYNQVNISKEKKIKAKEDAERKAKKEAEEAAAKAAEEERERKRLEREKMKAEAEAKKKAEEVAAKAEAEKTSDEPKANEATKPAEESKTEAKNTYEERMVDEAPKAEAKNTQTDESSAEPKDAAEEKNE